MCSMFDSMVSRIGALMRTSPADVSLSGCPGQSQDGDCGGGDGGAAGSGSCGPSEKQREDIEPKQ